MVKPQEDAFMAIIISTESNAPKNDMRGRKVPKFEANLVGWGRGGVPTKDHKGRPISHHRIWRVTTGYDDVARIAASAVLAVCAYYVKREIDDMFRRRREQRKLEAKASGEAVQRSLDEIAARLDALEGRRRGNVVPFRRAGA